MKSLIQYILKEQQFNKIDMDWIDNENPVCTIDGRQVNVKRVDYKEVPNIIIGEVYYKDSDIWQEFRWDDTGRCKSAKDAKGNGYAPGQNDNLVKVLSNNECKLLNYILWENNIFNIHYKIEEDLHIINEKHSTYEWQSEFVQYVSSKISQYIKDNKFQFRNKLDNGNFILKLDKEDIEETISNIICFFKEIILSLNIDNKTGYISSKSEYDVKNQLMSKIYISLDLQELNYDKIRIVLAHEITHAFEDWNRHLNKKEILSDILNKDNSYKEAMKLIHSDNISDKVISTYLYLNKQEVNAYISEFKEVVNNLYTKSNIITYKQCLEEWQETSSLWQGMYFISWFIRNATTKQKEDTIKVYMKMKKIDRMDASKLLKILNNYCVNIINKISNKFPKIYFDVISKDIKECKECLINYDIDIIKIFRQDSYPYTESVYSVGQYNNILDERLKYFNKPLEIR